MNRFNRQPDNNVVTHPEINEIEVLLHETSINFKPKKGSKPKELEQQIWVDIATDEAVDIAENENNEAAAAEK